ncbi:hypothetical protein [Ruegeria arenilitoris]|uniref:hypothetical protein n=1 Tax=Ruegeria arenilitoris TaxID=1173585 RepID=UPI00147CF9CF|nr:hypothetical protein [Ruegeria arenilitoris]
MTLLPRQGCVVLPVQGIGDSVVLSLQEVANQSHAKKFCLVMSLIGNGYDIFRIGPTRQQ